jgi:RimJ/RimL family protein N-acetyltransferase
MNIIIETKNFYLRILKKEDFEDIYRLYVDRDVWRYLSCWGVPKKEVAKKHLDFFLEHQKKHGFSYWAIIEKSTGNFVGRAGLSHLANTQDIEVGYVLDKMYWGKGYATEIAKAIIKWGFDNLDIDKIVAIAVPENKASIRVMEKVGMKYKKDYEYKGVTTVYYVIERSEK